MSSIEYMGNALCQALRLEGMSPGDEERVETRIRHLLEHNGPEFVVATLKLLKEHTIECLNGEIPFTNKEGNLSIAWNRGLNRPKGGLGLVYKAFPEPVSRVRVIGSMIQSIELDTLSENQIARFEDGLLSNNRTRSSVMIQFPDQLLMYLDNRIRTEWKHHSQYSAKEMTASALPYGPEGNVSIASLKRVLSHLEQVGYGNTDPSEVNRAIAQLDKHAVDQFYTAPVECRDYAKHMSSLSGNSVISLPRKGAVRSTPYKARPYEACKRDTWFPDYKPYVGNIGMLQQGGAKLRSVCNINRFTNWTLEPFAKALERTFYNLDPISVLNQDDGLAWVQKKLKEGESITSLDLSQATDLLDFRVLTRSLARMGEKTPYLSETAEYFATLAELPLYCPSLDYGIHFQTGQPLGMKGSFQVLTLMNYSAGFYAAKHHNLDPNDSFRVVGDDFVCLTEMADTYNKVIEQWSGKTNLEKSLVSDKYGEFLSHIVTRDHIYLVKPKYRPGRESIYVNAEKSTLERIQHVYRLSEEDKLNLSILSEFSDHTTENIPFIRGSRKRPKEDRELISKALDVIAASGRGGVPNGITVSPQTIDLAHQEHPSVVGSPQSRERDRRIFVQTPSGEVQHGMSRGSIHLDKGEFTTSVDRYDYKSGSRVDKDLIDRRQQREHYRATARKIRQLSNDLDHAVESPIRLANGMETTTTEVLVQALDELADQLSTKPIISHDETESDVVLTYEDLADLSPERGLEL